MKHLTTVTLAAALVLGLPSAAFAENEGPASPPPPQPSNLAQDYCDAFVKTAKKARDEREKADLQAIRDEIDAKLKEVNEKTATLEDWVKRREAMLSLASDQILKIYKSMDAVTASLELSRLDDMTATAILRKLDAKKASAILTEMDPKRGATLINILAMDSKLKIGQSQ